MKSFNFCKLPIVLLVLGGALTLAPSSRAQADLAPDHFDGTDSWVAAASAPVAGSKVKPAATTTVRSNPSKNTLQPVSARDVIGSHHSNALVANKKRKPAARKVTNQSN